MKDTKRILCYGDSNTWGYISGTGERYPTFVRWTGVLSQELGDTFQVVEAGLNGRTTVFDDSVALGRNGFRYLHVTMASAAPLDAMIIWLGTNDCKARFAATSMNISRGYQRLIQQASDPWYWRDGKVNIIIPLPIELTTAYLETTAYFEIGDGAIERSVGLIRRLPEDLAIYDHVSLIDLSKEAETDPLDGIHLTAAGHEKVGLRLAEYMKNRI
ncbi:MAG TPA: lipolytic enzyme, G-D-S-L [Clostridiaceae bacterium]|nr:lipolytic enzyme, G-D-S-L [Clostridiaceae bacterium]